MPFISNKRENVWQPDQLDGWLQIAQTPVVYENTWLMRFGFTWFKFLSFSHTVTLGAVTKPRNWQVKSCQGKQHGMLFFEVVDYYKGGWMWPLDWFDYGSYVPYSLVSRADIQYKTQFEMKISNITGAKCMSLMMTKFQESKYDLH